MRLNRSIARKKGMFWKRGFTGSWKKKILFFGFLASLVGLLVSFVGVLGLFAWYSRSLPSPTKVVRREGYTSRIVDRNQQLLYEVYEQANRTSVKWEDLPEYLREATVAIEDKNFWNHEGYDALTPLRIGYNLVFKGRLIGGSTLTQQLVKNVLLTSERKISRKIKEFVLAVQIEKKYTKEEILLMYLNEAPYGGTTWGVGTAAEYFFGKKVSELNLVESVFLAGLPQRPSVYSPFSKTPTAYVGRGSEVLRRMREDGYITKEQEVSALEELKSLTFKKQKTSIQAPHFVFWVKEQLASILGEDLVEAGGLKIVTTLDLEMQKQTEDIVMEEMEKTKDMGISNSGLVILDPGSGEVLTMLGSKDYFSDEIDGKYNVTTALRQPGSAIKPITYLTALRQGYTLSHLLMDTPVSFAGVGGQKDYEPENYNGKFVGPIQMRYALGNSINTTAVKMLAKVGLKDMLETAYGMGLSSLEPTQTNLSRLGLSVTLGGGEVRLLDLASAYSAFGNGGKKIEPVGVLEVYDKDGKPIWKLQKTSKQQVISAEEAWLVSDALADNKAREITFGSVNRLTIPGRKVAVKTGTTNDKRDNWCIGWDPSVMVAVWVGNNDNSPMKKVASGVSGATPIWQRVFQIAVKNRKAVEWPAPQGLVTAEVDTVSGFGAHDGFPARTEYFIQGTEPKRTDPVHQKLKVCKDKTGLATPADVASGNYDEKEYFVFREDDPVSGDGRNRWQEGIDKWLGLQSDDRYKPPSGYCRSDGLLRIYIEEPKHETTTGNQIHVKLRADAVEKVTEVKLFANGKEVMKWSEKPFEGTIVLDDGTYELHVEARDDKGNTAGGEIRIGVNKPWDWSASPTAAPTEIPTLTPVTTITEVPMATPSVTTIVSSPTPSKKNED